MVIVSVWKNVTYSPFLWTDLQYKRQLLKVIIYIYALEIVEVTEGHLNMGSETFNSIYIII